MFITNQGLEFYQVWNKGLNLDLTIKWFKCCPINVAMNNDTHNSWSTNSCNVLLIYPTHEKVIFIAITLVCARFRFLVLSRYLHSIVDYMVYIILVFHALSCCCVFLNLYVLRFCQKNTVWKWSRTTVFKWIGLFFW